MLAFGPDVGLFCSGVILATKRFNPIEQQASLDNYDTPGGSLYLF